MFKNNSKAILLFVLAILVVAAGWYVYAKYKKPSTVKTTGTSAIVEKGITANKKTTVSSGSQSADSGQIGSSANSSNGSSSGSSGSSAGSGGSGFAGDRIVIDKIKISAPVGRNIDGNNQQAYMKALEKGVAQLAGTATPGELGNSVIFGHSSYYRSQPGSYKTIFAKLGNLVGGDEIKVVVGGNTLSYKVFDKKIVSSGDVSVVMQDDKSQKRLTLITCWPVGTSNQRLVVMAKE